MKGETIIILEGGSLGGIKQRHRQLAERFARDNLVIYIDEPGNIITVFLSKEKPISNLWSWVFGLREFSPSLRSWTPPPGLPFGYIYPSINAWNHFWYRLWYSILCREKPESPVVIVNNVQAIKWLGFFNERFRIYDCCDEITGFKIPSLKPDVVREVERKLIESCDLVLCSSQKLLDTKSPLAKHTALVRNGAEVEHFRKALDRELPVPEHLKGIDKPVVGFWGYLADWLDWDIIEHIIRDAPEFHFLLIGPATKGLTKTIDADNVTYTGPLPYETLPEYLAHFSCAILPFRMNDLTEGVNPVKAYEYLAGGCPTVATPLLELKLFGGHIRFASDPESFLGEIRNAIADDTPELRKARADFVASDTWDARVEEIYIAISESGG